MSRTAKRVLVIVGSIVGAVVLVALVLVFVASSLFERSREVVYDVPAPNVVRSTDPEVLARGKHLAESIGACSSHDCHASDFAAGNAIDMGPLGTLYGSNITPGGVAASYSDGELARLILHGIKRDGRSVLFMPVDDFNWLSQEDVVAIVSYLRTVPPVLKEAPASKVGLLGKVLDRAGKVNLVVAEHLDHAKIGARPAAERSPSPAYGAMLAHSCVGCHGEHLSGGPIPGAPPSMPVPTNLTPDATGLADWAFADFDHLLDTGIRKNGTKVNPFMPFDSFSHLDDTERHALWAYLRSVPPLPMGSR